MCLTVLSWQPEHTIPLRVVANRDEFRNRPTQAMHWWPSEEILAGKDLRAGGTWLGFNKQGEFALLTNIRPGFVGVDRPISRGGLVTDFLTSESSIKQYHQNVAQKVEDYAGFNLILGSTEGLFWFSSTHPDGHWLEPGVHGLSNDSLNTPWPKTLLAIEQMEAHLNNGDMSLTDHDILNSSQISKTDLLPRTGIPLDWEIKLSAQTILGEDYGTRSRTHFTQSKTGGFDVVEQQIDAQGIITSSLAYAF